MRTFSRRQVLALGATAMLARPLRAASRADASHYAALIRERMASDGLVGVSAAILRDGAIGWSASFGMADHLRSIAMTTRTPVAIGSITKTFTALALQQLHHRRKLDLDAPLHRLLPEFAIGMRGFDADAITLRRIATHTSGLPTDEFRDLELERASYLDVPRLLRESDIAACPGTIGLYSNAGYSLLGNVVQVASGQDYRAYVRDHILRPLRMARSGFAGDPALPTPSKSHYPGGRVAPAFELRDQPAGGLYASVEDLMRYARGMIAGWRGDAASVVPHAVAQEMFALHNADILVETNKKGFGWFLFDDGRCTAPYHAGSTIYSNAALLLLPQRNAAAAIVVNTVGGDGLAQDFAFDVLQRHGMAPRSIRPAPHLPAPDPDAGEIEIAATSLAAHVGDYASKNGYLSVERDGPALREHSDGAWSLLRPLANGGFRAYALHDGALRPTGEERHFVDVGPYHVLFRRAAGDESALAHRVDAATVDIAPLLGCYTHFGYQTAGAEQLLAAHVERWDGRLPMLRLSYNTGDYRYPLLFSDATRAITGGLGPEMTGQTVRFEDGGKVLVYAGITFRKQ